MKAERDPLEEAAKGAADILERLERGGNCRYESVLPQHSTSSPTLTFTRTITTAHDPTATASFSTTSYPFPQAVYSSSGTHGRRRGTGCDNCQGAWCTVRLGVVSTDRAGPPGLGLRPVPVRDYRHIVYDANFVGLPGRMHVPTSGTGRLSGRQALRVGVPSAKSFFSFF